MIECNFEKTYNRFMELSEKNMGKCLRTGLRKALTEVKRNTVTNLNEVVKNAGRKNPKYTDTLVKGVRMTKIYQNYKGEICGKVTIASTNETGSGSFRLMILESGSYKKGERFQTMNKTTMTKLKKPRSLGVLPAKHFFKKTQDTMSGYFQNTMNDAIAEAVDKTNKEL